MFANENQTNYQVENRSEHARVWPEIKTKMMNRDADGSNVTEDETPI